jgi:SAM-dependent methyltransferase
MSSMTQYFDELYRRDDDPWKLRKGWYEQRKRSLTLALLPRPHYRNAFEPGCANGELTAELATRCDVLLAADLNATAVRLARERVAAEPHVRLEQRTMPAQWPHEAGPFDLIVISELAYYLDATDLNTLAAWTVHCSRVIGADHSMKRSNLPMPRMRCLMRVAV